MQQQTIRVTDVDSRRLQFLIEGPCPRDVRDAGSVELLEHHLDDAEVMPARGIDPDVVTMNSEVRVHDLDTPETLVFRVVFPKAADAAAGKISVLAPLGMAVLGRRVGEQVAWQTPGGLRRLRVDRVLYQPEREGKDVA
ncbi:MAG: GreA/GreB family elongation factor [Candidatus Methylomirabilales bacterium]